MTKAELIEALQPFDDEIEICVLSVNPNCVHTVLGHQYSLDGEYEGLFVLQPNAPRILIRERALNTKATREKQAITIDYDPRYRAFWHVDCAADRSPPMRAVKHDDTRSLITCLRCEQSGYYPVGGSGSLCVEVVNQSQNTGAGQS